MKRPHRRNVPSKCEKVAASLAAALRRTKAPSIAARNACGGGTGAAMRCFRFMADDQSSISLSSPGSGSGGTFIGALVETDQTIAANIVLSSGKNAVSVGDVAIAAGYSVTVPSGARWVVV